MSVRQKVTKFGFLFDKVLRAEIQKRGISPAIVPAALTCNLFCILDARSLHFVVVPSQGTPNQIFIDRRLEAPISPSQAVEAAVKELGFVNPSGISFDAKLPDLPEALQLQSADKTAKQLVTRCIRRATRPSAIQGYEGLQPLIDSFSDATPSLIKTCSLPCAFVPASNSLRSTPQSRQGCQDTVFRVIALTIRSTLQMEISGQISVCI